MTTTPAEPDLDAVKRRQQETWTAGDFVRIGSTMDLMGALLCEAVDVHSGETVLDVACGSGTTALAAARRFCRATGVDYVPELIEAARERARVERLPATFEVGDAEDLPYPDASFDVVVSTIGVMFAPDQERAARELLRVCRPGGRIGLANWTPDGFIGDMFRTFARHAPPPAGVASPLLWGTDERLRELLGDGVVSLHAPRRTFVFRYPSVEHKIDYLRTYFGPALKAFESLDAAGRDALERDLAALFERWNTSGDRTLVLPADYLEVVAVRADG